MECFKTLERFPFAPEWATLRLKTSMNSLISNPAVKSLLRGILVWAPLWILTTIIFGGLGVGYAFLIKTDTFVASQALLVRDEANGAVMRLGRFQSQTEMKAAQETILEMTKSHQVVHDALVSVGQPPTLVSWLIPSTFAGTYPSKELVEETAKQAIVVHAPKGTEFGTTEIIYLDIKSNSKEHAVQLNKAICDSLESRLQQVRKARADGVISELVSTRESRRAALTESTNQLVEIERAAGSDLTDLRGLTETVGGNSTSRAELEQVKNEIRQAEVVRQAFLSDREMLVKASDNPQGVLMAPASILNAHPGLKRMREGLVDSQIQGANILGKFTPEHPSAIASQSAQNAIASRFSEELKAAIVTVDADIALVNSKIERLEAQQKRAEDRLASIAKGRAAYANLVAEVKSRTSLLESAERELAGAQAARDSSVSTSLLTRLDAPIVSDRPIGPGKTTLAGLSAIAGLVFGLGVVFAITPIDLGPSYGRRARDRAAGRRGSDEIESVPASPTEISSPEETATKTPLTRDKITSSRTVAPGASTDDRSPSSKRAKLNLKFEIEPVEDSVAPQQEESSNEVHVEDVRQDPPHQAASLSSQVPGEVDQAFRELARLKSVSPVSRSEELAVDMKIQEISSILQSLGHRADTEVLQKEGYLKPRSTRS